MTKSRNPLDRSAMFTCLLDLSQTYGLYDARDGAQITTQALAEWYESPSTDMYAWTREWITTRHQELLPLR